MRLSKRIHALADSVTRGHSAADIGTDHGYVPMLLIRDGISPRVIMSDISEGSLAKAKETFRQCGLMDKVSETDFRTGDGLGTVGEGEVDDIIIGGLGGHTIIDILDADISKSRSFRRLILQPRKHSGALRYWLYVNGWDIENEVLAPEGKFVCEIIIASPSGEKYREPEYDYDDIRWKYPEYLVDTDPELAYKRISWKKESLAEQIENLYNAREDNSERIKPLHDDYRYLQYLLAVAEEHIENSL